MHKTPTDLRMALSSDAKARAAWRGSDAAGAERMDLLGHLGQTDNDAQLAESNARSRNFRRANAAPVVGPAVRIADPARRNGSRPERANG